jgi:hypothetical protein
VLRAHSLDGAGYGFDRTVVPLQLMLTGGATGLESRAQAKRVASRLQTFRRAEVDFSGIATSATASPTNCSASSQHATPGEIVPVGMSPRVAAMIDSIVAGA